MSELFLASSGPGLKQKTTEADDAPGTAAATGATVLTRSGIWFEDGNIILQAQTTQFRVHRGIIVHHSSVFKDMFAMPQATRGPGVEDCAIVHLTDKPEDWKNVLNILYDSFKTYRSTENIPFSTMESMLRLGKKYEFRHLWDIGMDCLRAGIPQTLDLWEKKFDSVGHRTRKDKITCHQFDLINLLFELGLNSFLPTALYQCLADYTTETILRGSSREDTDTPVHLIYEAQMTLIIGKEKILQSRMRHLDEWFRTVEGCRDSINCHSRQAITLKGLYRHPESLVSPSILFGMWSLGYLCGHCTSIITNRMKRGRPAVWDELPGYFGLPDWVDIKDD